MSHAWCRYGMQTQKSKLLLLRLLFHTNVSVFNFSRLIIYLKSYYVNSSIAQYYVNIIIDIIILCQYHPRSSLLDCDNSISKRMYILSRTAGFQNS